MDWYSTPLYYEAKHQSARPEDNKGGGKEYKQDRFPSVKILLSWQEDMGTIILILEWNILLK